MTETVQPSEIDNILRRVHKLLAIAGDSRANPAEAAAAASQAEKIMRKYQIENADVIAASMKLNDYFDTQDIGGTMNTEAVSKSTTSWAGMLALAIARLNDCKSAWVRSPKYGVCIRYSGYKSDTQVALWTHQYIVNQLIIALGEHKKTNPTHRKESESFRKGFIVAVIDNIEQAIEEKKLEMTETSNSRDLVLVKTQAVFERFGIQKIKLKKYNTGAAAYQKGHSEGSKLNINVRGVSDNSSPTVHLN
jgi:hypothetical protein